MFKNKKIYEEKINNLISKSKFKISNISICLPLESISVFNGYMRLCGIGMWLKINNENLTAQKINNLQSELSGLYNKTFHGEENKIEEIINLTLDQRKMALEFGKVSFACIAEYLKDKTVKSYYGDFDEHYAPLILKLFDKKENLLLEHIKKCQHSELIKGEHKPFYYELEIELDNKIEENDLSKLYELIKEILEIYNDYVTNDYNKNKNKKKYQHRHDFNPEYL